MNVLVKGGTFPDFPKLRMSPYVWKNALLVDTGCKPLEILEEGQHFIILPHVFEHCVMLSHAVPGQWNAKGLYKFQWWYTSLPGAQLLQSTQLFSQLKNAGEPAQQGLHKYLLTVTGNSKHN